MKKIFALFAICIFLLSVPTSTAILRPTLFNQSNTDAPPDWAQGNFSGVWGINVVGQPFVELGWVEGYYSQVLIFGRFEAKFAKHNTTNATGKIGGLLIGPFMLGGLEELSTGNETIFSGLGGVNETNFYFRMMGIIGPTYYMFGNYTKFE